MRKENEWFSSGDTGKPTESGTQEYKDFVKKFEPKRTTDDCYTPPEIYEVIAGWVASEYGIDRSRFVRPFYPGGDYKNFDYQPDDVVVDNPPFSILTEIIRWYDSQGIKFFIFSNALNSLHSASESSTTVCANAAIRYENGAEVRTSFKTNLESDDVAVRTAPELSRLIKEANDKLKGNDKKLPTYKYPANVSTGAALGILSNYGLDLKIPRNECEFVRRLDDQKRFKKTIYGGGFIVSDRIAAELKAAELKAAELKAAEQKQAIIWELSDREKEIIERLNKNYETSETTR